MEKDNREFERTKENAESQDSEKPTGFETIKNTLASKMHNAAEVLEEKVAEHDPDSKTAQYGNKASKWLDDSADFVENFDWKEADSKVRDYVSHKPGRSLLMAGAVGLVIGTLLRRR